MIRASAIAVAVLTCAVPAAAQLTIPPGQDPWKAVGENYLVIGGSIPPLPLNFFGPGSEPFIGRIEFSGTPTLAEAHDASATVQRLGLATVAPGGPAEIPIELVSLSLVSVAPIQVTFAGPEPHQAFFDVFFQVNPAAPGTGGSAFVKFEGPTNSHVSYSLSINPVLLFRAHGDPTAPLIPAPIPPFLLLHLDTKRGAAWSTTPPADRSPFAGPNFFATSGLTLFSGSGEVKIMLDPASAAADCNANGFPDAAEIANHTVRDSNHDCVPDSCQIPFDFDLDGEPDDEDIYPFVFSRDSGLAPTISVTQLSVEDARFGVVSPRTEHAEIVIDVPNSEDQTLWINVVVNGQWSVQNMLALPLDPAVDVPFERYSAYTTLGVTRGTLVPSVAVGLYVTPYPLTVQPVGAPLLTVPVLQGGWLTGLIERIISRLDLPPASAYDVPADPPGKTQTSYVRPGYDQSDLDNAGTANSCAPGACASSMAWLDRIYCLESGKTQAEMLDKLRRAMGTVNGAGPTSWAIIAAAKEGLIRACKLPVTVEKQGPPIDGQPASMDDMYQQMRKGQDVEAYYEWYFQKRDAMGNPINNPDGTPMLERGTHAVSVVGMSRAVDATGMVCWTIDLVDDSDQDSPGGNNSRNSATATQNPDGTWTWHNTPTDATFLGWTAESPTAAATAEAIRMKTAELQAKLAAVGNAGADTAVAEGILRQAHRLKWLARTQLDSILASGFTPSAVPRIIQAAIALAAACDALDAAKTIHRESGTPGTAAQLEAINDLRQALTRLASATAALQALSPPDADHDGVPNATDSAPNAANPDQADCNGNGVADVLELSPLTDRNGNGLIDSCEIAAGLDTDCNSNGVPDRYDISSGASRDANGNGVPDECECRADFDRNGSVQVTDIFAFLSAWFAQGAGSDFNSSGATDVADIFAFLSAWFAGCP